MKKFFLPILLSIITVMLLSGCSQANQTVATDTPDEEFSGENIAVNSPAEPEETPVEEQPAEIAVDEEIDPNSKVFPSFEDFLSRKASIDKKYFSNGREYQFINLPAAAYETVRQELVTLLLEPKYQLELTEQIEDETDKRVRSSYCFRYTGAAPDMEEIHDEDETLWGNAILVIRYWKANETFGIQLLICDAFDMQSPECHSSQDVGESNVGKYDSHTSDSSDHTFTPEFAKLDCLTCDGSGDCQTCGGDGYKGIGEAKGGCNTCKGNGKCRVCGGSGKR